MDLLCGDLVFAEGTLANDSRGVAWLSWTRSACHCHLVNVLAALTATYLALLLLICLRCSGEVRSCRGGPPPRLRDARAVLSVALLLSLVGELAEALLVLGRGGGVVVGAKPWAAPLAASLSAVLAWLPCELLDAQLARSHAMKAMRLVPAAYGALLAVMRVLSAAQMWLWGGAGPEHMRPLLAATTALLFLLVAVVDLVTWRFQRRKNQGRGAPDGIYVFSSYCYEGANLYSKATFSWLTPLLRLGNSSPLELEDLGRIPHSESTAVHFEKFLDAYNSMKKTDRTVVSIWRCFLLCSWRMLALSGLFKLSGDLVGFVGPMGISIIVLYVQGMAKNISASVPPDLETVSFISVQDFFSNGYIMGILIFLAALAQGTFSQSSTHLINVEGIRLKAALQAMVYDKSLRLPLWSFSEKDEFDESLKEIVSSSSPPSTSENDQNGQSNKSENVGSLSTADIAAESQPGATASHTDFGTIINLMSEDTCNVMSFVWISHYIWAIPVKIGCLMFLLHYQLGISALIGAILCVSVMTPLQFIIGKRMSANSKAISIANDERLRRTNEVIQGIKVIKLSGWEDQYERKVQQARNQELRLLNLDSLHWALMTFLTHASSAIVTLVTFGIYMLLEKSPLPTASVFAGLALFNQLTVPLFIFPITVPIIISAMVSARRLEVFLSKPETANVLEYCPGEEPAMTVIPEAFEMHGVEKHGDPLIVSSEPPRVSCVTPEKCGGKDDDRNLADFKCTSTAESLTETKEYTHRAAKCSSTSRRRKLVAQSKKKIIIPSDGKSAGRGSVVSITDGRFSWSTGHVLSFSDVVFPKGVITLVVGPIGSGKTSLLLALLGEMSSLDGRYPVRWSADTSVAYCSQKPWLLDSHVRENILFGEPLRRKRYAEVIAACALQPDLDILPTQDLTEIGERGINLSGGQKHRVAIARALYSNASTVLMDDPLSALDYQVGRHLVEEGFRKLLKLRGRTLILATHCLPLLSLADYIIVMEHGKVSVQGTLSQIQSERPDLGLAWQQTLTTTGTSAAPSTLTASCSSESRVVGEARGERTARERWQLVRLVSRIGLQQRSDESLTPRHSRRFSQRHSRSLYRCNRHTHNFPLPVDEYHPDGFVDRPLLRRTRSTSASAGPGDAWRDAWRRKVKRVSSLQPHDTERYPTLRRSSDAQRTFDHRPINLEGGTLGTDMKSGPSSDDAAVEDASFTVNYPFLTELDSECTPTEDSVDNTDRQSLHEAGRKYGRVSRHVYLNYAKACTVSVFSAYFVSTLLWQTLRVYTDFWLSDWTALNGTKSAQSMKSAFSFQREMVKYLLVYSLLSIATMLLSLTSNLVGQLAGAKARNWLHRNLLANLLRCPVKFFDTTPIGRVIDRFSTDIAVIDKKLSTSIQRLMQFLSLCLSAVLVNAILSPWFLLPALPMCLAYYTIQHFYRVSTRELHRLESLTRSPVSSFFSETLGGLATIRAFGQKRRFMELMLARMDVHNNTFLVLSAANRWLGVALDYMGGAIVLVSVIGSLMAAQFYPGSVSPSLVGLAINYTLLVPIYLNWVVKFLADVEMYMGSVERVQQYTEMPREDYNSEGLQVSPTWPEYGDIQFNDVSLRYDENREPVIRKLNLHIPAGQKVGLCGRTGSGKSSLVMSLFRMLDVSEGSIHLDGIEISTLPLQLLRSRLSVIPQDIVMFSGSIRENLDPKGSYTDKEIWECLQLSQLKYIVEKLPGGLDSTIKEGGENLSVGTRQLFCLARAILQNAAILVMDEATSSVDPTTEQAFLSVALNAFAHRTVIIIAHRLSTLLDCNRVLVLENGKVIEDGSPSQLLRFDNGVFSLMLKSAS